MKSMKFMALAMAAVFALFATSCNKDDKEGFDSMELTSTSALVIKDFQGHDATAAYPLTFSVKLVDGYLTIENGSCKPSPAGVSAGLSADASYNTEALIADFGKSSCLKNVDSYPTSTYEAKVVCEEGHGYVVKAYGKGNVNAYNRPEIHDPADLYVRIYIEEATDNGYTIRYQYPFEVE